MGLNKYSQVCKGDLKKLAALWQRAAIHSTAIERTSCEQWARNNRVYPPSMDKPGPRDPGYTPYIIDFINSFDDPAYETSALVCGSQMGKTDGVLDVIGSRLDQRPVPTLYVGPSQDFVAQEIEPRVMETIEQSSSLKQKYLGGKRQSIFKKVISGVPLRFGWAGSATQLAGMSAGLCLIDEYDRMLQNVKGEGDPYEMVKARGFTFRGRKYGVTSTPLVGNVEVEKCDDSGLEFWKVMPPEDVESAIWRLFQQGTMHHFAWPCPECHEYFIPRFRNLKWEKGSSPAEARDNAYVECPNCGGVIEERHKADLNSRGVYVAPGQHVDQDGNVHGEAKRTKVFSCWVSGLCSPFKELGERAEDFIAANESGVPSRVQGVINTGMGELWAPAGGEAPEWQEVAALRQPIVMGRVPDWVQKVTAGIDVQISGVYYVVRGWGEKGRSILLDYGQLFGATRDDDNGLVGEVWDDVADLLEKKYDGLPILTAFIDSGDGNVTSRVYEFCRDNPRNAVPVKGSKNMRATLSKSSAEVTPKGQKKKWGLSLWFFHSDYYKSFVHERIRRPVDSAGSWLLPEDVSEDYCRQIVAEALLKKPSGQTQWVKKSRHNHYLDCEAMAAAAGDKNNVARLKKYSRTQKKEDGGKAVKGWADMAAAING